MLATVPSAPPQAQHNVRVPPSPAHAEDGRLCAGCSLSVSSETGGVVVAFGDSLWHVDCFKCAKCGIQVNADTNLLLLSDGSPVCANCYNCKVCKQPILDEAVMTGDDSFHAECFTCRSCKNRIDELVFAKTSQGFYCMKCHNERVARSRRHIAKQKQRQKERERTAMGGAGGQSAVPADGGGARSAEGERTSGSQSGHSSPPRSASPASALPAVSVTVAGPSNAPSSRSRSNSHETTTHGDTSVLDGPPPPPYSQTSPPPNVGSDIESARSSASYGSTQPTSPSLSVSVSHEGSTGDHGHASDRAASSALPYLGSGTWERANSLTPRERDGEPDSRSGWPADMEQEKRSKSPDNGTRPLSAYLHPKTGTIAALSVTKTRGKRSSINPGLQLEASKLQLQNQRPGSSSSASPASPTAAPFASAHASIRVSAQSPTAHQDGRNSPRVTSPLRDYFIGIDDDSSGSTAFYSPSPSPQPHTDSTTSPRSVPLTSQPVPSAAKDFHGRFPQRSDSLRGINSSAALNPPAAPVSRANGLPSSPYNGRLHTPTPLLRSQRSFDGHGGLLSSRKAEFSVDGGKRSRSNSPKPPDVPRSIESGTDTETDAGNDSDDITQSYIDRGQQPPVPPPKDVRDDNVLEAHDRSPIQPSSEPSSTGLIDGDDFSLEKEHEDNPALSSVTERTSGYFIAPALPPMRFSMSGTDFHELLSNLGGSSSSKRLSILTRSRNSQSDNTVTIPEKGEEVATAKTPTSIASTIMPFADANANGLIRETTERNASLKGKKTVAAGPLLVYANGERVNGAAPAAVSPTTPIRPEVSKRLAHRSSKSDPSAKVLDESSSPRSSAESRRPGSSWVVNDFNGHERVISNGASEMASPRILAIAVPRNGLLRQDSAELVSRRLKEALSDANERSADYVKLDRAFVEAIISSLDQKREQMNEMSTKLDGMKRTSQMMIDGLSVAQDEYIQELAARRNAEEEVSRLKIELSGHAARITALSSDERRREVQNQLTKELSESLTDLEKDLSKLRVERDMTLAEIEELSASKNLVPNGDVPSMTVGRSLTMRLDNIKQQYQHDLIPLTQQREVLVREILELKEARDIFLEETAVLNARNEELAQLNTQYERRLESAGHSRDKSLPAVQPPAQSKAAFDTWKARQAQAPPIVNTTSTSSSATLIDEVPESRQQKPVKAELGEMPVAQRTRIGLRWPGNKANKEAPAGALSAVDNSKGKKRQEHAFQQLSILRFARCDLCGDKMWGSQVRCSACNMAVHVRCVGQVHTSCTHDGSAGGSEEHLAPVGPPPSSMFGRDLIEQVREDSKNSDIFVPIIVEKCIDAVEALAMDYEGIYRKTGGSGQSKAITSLFERGDYDSFDLCDSDSFNDISSVTSVLKNYFRMLPNPLLTYGMHEAFVAAGGIKDPHIKGQALKDLVKQLPAEHYHTLSRLMLHLHRVQLQVDVNLMNARNLGVIFGPTLMRSSDPSREFADMAGKSLAIEYLIENAPSVFPTPAS